MSDQPGKEIDQPGKEIAERDEDPAVPQTPLQLLTQILELERARIASSNAQTDIARASFEVTDNENERRHEVTKDRIERDDAHRIRSWRSKTKMIWTGIIVAVVVLAIFLSAAFLGGETERQTAFTLTSYLLSGGAFLGLGYVLGSRARS